MDRRQACESYKSQGPVQAAGGENDPRNQLQRSIQGGNQ